MRTFLKAACYFTMGMWTMKAVLSLKLSQPIWSDVIMIVLLAITAATIKKDTK